MKQIKYSKIFMAKERARKQHNIETYQDAIKSIENDEEYIKLLNILKQKYEDNNEDISTISIQDVLELDFDYFAQAYGEKAFIARDKNYITK